MRWMIVLAALACVGCAGDGPKGLGREPVGRGYAKLPVCLPDRVGGYTCD